jgi:4-amino-4-deoxy-L-arabinose transferase-like glycosyltransferase
MKLSSLQWNIIIALAALLLFIPFLGSVHLFDWDEINFAEAAREMILTGDYSRVQINFQPFWEKPPLFLWMQVLSMKVFGINEFAARLPNALCGVTTLLILFNSGSKLYNRNFGLLWALAYAGSLLPQFYFRSGIIDPWFNLFVFLGIQQAIIYTLPVAENKFKNLIFSAVFIGLAILTKGPVALLIFGLCVVFFLLAKDGSWRIISLKHFILFSGLVLLTGFSWFILEVLRGRGEVVQEFIDYQIRLFSEGEAGHGQPFYYHFIVLLFGCFPVSILFFLSFRRSDSDSDEQRHFKVWMQIMFWVVLVLFSMVKTKIVHYSSLTYYPLTFLGAWVAMKIAQDEIIWRKRNSFALLATGGLVALVLTSLQFVENFKETIIALKIIKDDFAVANIMSDVEWIGYEFFTGILLLSGVIAFLFCVKWRLFEKGFYLLFFSTMLATWFASLLIVPKAEQYTQRAAIDFYESLKDKDCYVETIDFKSYAYLFYSDKKKPVNPESLKLKWLLKGAIDKPAYFVSKNIKEQQILKNYPKLEVLYRKNGFVFYQRKN